MSLTPLDSKTNYKGEYIIMKKLVNAKSISRILVVAMLIATFGVLRSNEFTTDQQVTILSADTFTLSWLTDHLVNDPDDGTRDWITTPIRNGDLDELIEYLNEQRNMSA